MIETPSDEGERYLRSRRDEFSFTIGTLGGGEKGAKVITASCLALRFRERQYFQRFINQSA